MSSIGEIVDLAMSEIYTDDDFNCRGRIIPMDVLDLARDIAKDGLRNPIIVQKMPDNRYRVVAGHRRHMAFRVNKSTTIPCIVRVYANDFAARSENLKENLIRKQLNIMQECKALGPFINAHWTDGMMAKEFQQSIGWVQIRRELLTLSPEIQAEAAAGFLTQDQIRIISKLPESKRHEKVREIKEAKIRGEKVKLDKPPRKRNPLVKRERRKTEIEQMIGTIADVLGMNFATRCLAWAAGNVSDSELMFSFKSFCDQEGYEFPVELLRD